MYYETIFIVNPDVSQENTEKLVDSLKTRIEKTDGARVVKQEYWGVRPLAYSIARRKRGHYVLLVTDGSAKALAALEQALRLEERVLRFMTTKLEEVSDQPSAIIRRRESASRQATDVEAAKLEAADTAGEGPAPAEPEQQESANAEPEAEKAATSTRKTTKDENEEEAA